MASALGSGVIIDPITLFFSIASLFFIFALVRFLRAA
jgi:hypothetical protein